MYIKSICQKQEKRPQLNTKIKIVEHKVQMKFFNSQIECLIQLWSRNLKTCWNNEISFSTQRNDYIDPSSGSSADLQIAKQKYFKFA